MGLTRRLAALGAWSLAILLFNGSASHAHVKWFAPYDVQSDPVPLDAIRGVPFAIMTAAIMVLFLTFVIVEQTRLKHQATWILDRLFTPFHDRLDDMMRAGTAAFLICLWVLGGVLLTPELTTDKPWIPWLQAGLALCLFWRDGLPTTAAGIVFLWAFAAKQYGLFHLLDYPIFLGIAIYLVVCAFPDSPAYRHRFDILRWGAAITLMWASVEKVAYPDWAYPVLERMPFLTLGLSNLNFMYLAGIAEFVLAFALVWTPLARRLSALLLAIIFTAAIIPFGKIDAVGHLMIILILITIAADRRPVAIPKPSLTTVPAAGAGLTFFFAIYYGAQAYL
ncbi:MAG: hypothetical protein AAGF58_05135 [Pseudomonadota bacterium]